ncbi:TPA: 2-nitroimidazole transporter [Escherichia coli]|nr:2-nitroimidazole transporter [Escherichia coli]
MTCSTSLSGKNRIVLIAGILMIATTLRVTFTGAAPLLDTIRSAYSLTTAQTGLLTTLPLLAFALISTLAAPVARRFGMERSLFAALLLICAGIAIRSLPSPYLLFGGTAVIGGGIALGNVLLPGLIKRDFPHSVARLTGAYSLTMGAAAALGSAMVVPLALNGFGWQGALLMLMCFPLLALFLWLPQWRSQQHANLSTSRALHTRGIWRSPLAWQVTLFLGINSLVYYVIIGWLPAILISHGYSEAQAGSLHGLLQLATAAPGLLIPLFLHHVKDQRGIAAFVALMCAVGAVGLCFMPAHAITWTLLFGFGSGATMILGLTFIGLRASSAHQAAALSGMAQSVGYLLAACGPPLMGKIHDANGNWSVPLMGVAILSLLMAIFGLCAGRDKEIR